jgi:hypothetical protein
MMTGGAAGLAVLGRAFGALEAARNLKEKTAARFGEVLSAAGPASPEEEQDDKEK